MPRILLSTAHITPLVLTDLGIPHTTPEIVADIPPLPKPFYITQQRLDTLKGTDMEAYWDAQMRDCADSAQKEFCRAFEKLDVQTAVAKPVESVVKAVPVAPVAA